MMTRPMMLSMQQVMMCVSQEKYRMSLQMSGGKPDCNNPYGLGFGALLALYNYFFQIT